ncbi:protein broad-minded-like [Phymastichus coffea]|uniref:protein broad-minded-like n=1 Tax=Phymastichus coffea TaxID=108790 RepID=UPI00273AE357|nr:protein broad-minded-like [Phymastichus coffea]
MHRKKTTSGSRTSSARCEKLPWTTTTKTKTMLLNDEFQADAIDIVHLTNVLKPLNISRKINREFARDTDLIDDLATSSRAASSATNSRPDTALSYISEDDWGSTSIDEIGQIIDQMSNGRPDHVRLAGYEAILESDLASLPSNRSWDALLKVLRDGLVDGRRSVFEASLLAHAKLLNCQPFVDTYASLLEAFSEIYHSKKQFDTLPTVISGVNFRIFLHEKLFRVMRLILDQHEEILKTARATDKVAEEVSERFVSFLCVNSTMSSHAFNALHIVSVMEPQAGWSSKWMHGLATRRCLCSAMSKSPSLARTVVALAKRYLTTPSTAVSVTLRDEPADLYVSGDSVETLTFLHCLHLVTQLCAHSSGRALLSDTHHEDSFSVPDFLGELLGALNVLASSEASNALYGQVRSSLFALLRRNLVLYDARFRRLTVSPLLQSEVRMWPHTLDVLAHMLDTQDGPAFLTSEQRVGSASIDARSPNCPATIVICYTASLMRQPLAVMTMPHVVELCRFMKKLFADHEVYCVVEEAVRLELFPSVKWMYGRLDKYYVENENKTQQLDKAVREMLLSVVAQPLGLQLLSKESLIFDELIRGSIAPVRPSWSAYDVVGFVSNSGYLTRGTLILVDLAPHVLSTLLSEVSKSLEDPKQFHDPWDNDDAKVFLHVLALLSLNTNCFMAFMTTEPGENDSDDEKNYPKNLYEFFHVFIDVDSPYHHLGLLALKTVIWNLDVYIYLRYLLDFETKLLQYQEYATLINEPETIDEDDDAHAGMSLEPPEEASGTYIVDECSLLRHNILLNCYYAKHKRAPPLSTPEDTQLFSTMPPPVGIYDDSVSMNDDNSVLNDWLENSGYGLLRDMSWVAQTQKAHKASPGRIKSSVFLNLLAQMAKAIPTAEWMDRYQWKDLKFRDNYFLPEEKHAMNLVIHYGVLSKQIEKANDTEDNLRMFIQLAHNLITYNKAIRYQGFDWFLATVFLISHGDLDKAKTCITQIIKFPSAAFMWPALAQVVDETDDREASTRLLFAHMLETIVNNEFPIIKFALKRECGLDWWMICGRLLNQSFLGILPWSEIMHFFAMCILHTPDYIVYYCVSLLNHCEGELMKNIVKGKMWPEDLVLEDYRCHSQIGFMDRLSKRHGGKVLPLLTQRSLNLESKED